MVWCLDGPATPLTLQPLVHTIYFTLYRIDLCSPLRGIVFSEHHVSHQLLFISYNLLIYIFRYFIQKQQTYMTERTCHVLFIVYMLLGKSQNNKSYPFALSTHSQITSLVSLQIYFETGCNIIHFKSII